jgi:hypothetical protein
MVKFIPFLVIALLSKACSGQADLPGRDHTGGTYSAQTLSYNNVGASPGVTPTTFGAHGDAIRIQAGCNATASSTTVTCNGTSFVSGDVGKQFWIPGAGAAGVAEHTTISSVTNSTTVVVAAAASTSVTSARVIYGHDDASAIQACWNYSSANQVQCVMNGSGITNTGYLVGSAGLQIMTKMQVSGNSYTQGTNIWCEFNGDCVSLKPGPDTGVNLSNLEIWADGTQPLSRGIHLNAQTGQGVGFGGLFNANLNNIQVENMANECLWLDGGGGAGYTFNLPNQYVHFLQFNCNGPIQMHTPNMILMTGQNAQITFIQGAVNGIVDTAANPRQQALWISYYPNPLIAIHEKTGGMNDSPDDVKFFGYTYEVGMQGLYVSQAANIHYDNGYIEQIATPLIVLNSTGVTFNGNHIANSGTVTGVASFPLQSTVAFRDNTIIADPSHTVAALAVCKNNSNTIDFVGNSSPVTATSDCATAQVAPTTSTLSVAGGQTVFVNGSSTPITTISAPGASPGKTLTLYAAGTITLAAGGNINFGGLPAPLTIAGGQSVTLTLFDLGPAWLITSTTAVTASASIPATSDVLKGAGSAGPYSTFFDDFYSGANMASRPIGSATADTCAISNAYSDVNHPGNMVATAGTAGTGSGIVCGLISENPSIASANNPLVWTWETAVYVPVLPTTNPGSYQVGMAHTPNENPWTSGIGFYLSSANSSQSHWYCRYSSTGTDSHVSAVVAWTRLTMSNDGSLVHWYINGHEVCGTGVPIASLPSTTQYPALWSATALSGTSVSLAYDYINWQRVVDR